MKTIAIILLTALTLFTSCGSTKRNNFIVLVDNSLTVPETVFERYIQTIQQSIIVKLGSKNRLTVQFIDGCSQSMAERVYSIDLAAMDFSSDADGINYKEDSAAARLKRFVTDSVVSEVRRAILAKRKERNSDVKNKCSQFTDIIGALNEAKSLIDKKKNYSNTKDKILNDADGKDSYEYVTSIIVFSDMVNENSERTFDFTQMGKIKSDGVEKKVQELKDIDKIPDMANINVVAYGATSTKEAGPYANKQIENVKLFWELFFKSAGADLKGYGYDTDAEIKSLVADN
jgi:hypothetical protein